MSSLRDLQQRAYRAIVLDETLIGAPSPSAAARLEVYRNNARETFRRTLAAMYPVVRELVGDPCFRSLAGVFMREFPSRSGDLGGFGGEFPMLLDICYRDTPFAYCSDVARLEVAVAAAETAADAEPLDPSRLASVSAHEYGGLRFVFHPAARLLTSRWPVLSIWRAHQGTGFARIDASAGAEHVLVGRRDGRVTLRGLEPDAFAFARTLADGESLSDAVDAGCESNAGFDARAALTLLANFGTLVNFRLSWGGVA